MKKVILAEDIKAIVEEDDSFLNRIDVETVAAATNDEILALHRAEKANLIITNLDMPGMSGDDLCLLIRDDNELRTVSIIIVSPDTEENLQRCTHCRANAFISSPVNTAVLLQEAYQLLNIVPRRACRIPLKLTMEGTAKERPFSGSIENISAAGMLFLSNATFFEGDTIHCSFSLEDRTRISATAEIIRVMKQEEKPAARNCYGVRFADISDLHASAIEAFVATLATADNLPC